MFVQIVFILVVLTHLSHSSHVFYFVFLLEWEAFAFALRLSLGISRSVHFVQLFLMHGSTLAYYANVWREKYRKQVSFNEQMYIFWVE